MKNKLLVGAVMVAGIVSGCQNEAIENKSVGGETYYSLKLNKGVETRTTLGENRMTLWSEGDEVLVTSEDGKVTGILRLIEGKGTNSGLFEGVIRGGEASDLKHIVFPAPKDGKIDMANRDKGQLDVPMLGTIGNGNEDIQMKNVGGLLAVVAQGEGSKGLTSKATTDETEPKNMSGGFYTFANGYLTYHPVNNPAPIVTSEDGYAYIAVATTTDPTNGTEDDQSISVNVVISDAEGKTVAETGAPIEINKGKIFGNDKNEETNLNVSIGEDGKPADIVVVSTLDELRNLAESAEGDVNIMLTNDIVMGNESETCDALQFNEKVTSLTIYGNNKKLTLRGKAPYDDNADRVLAGIMACTSEVTIKNLTIVNEKLNNEGLKYDADRGTVYSFVRGLSVTYDGVIFDGGVQVKSNETFIGCTFTEDVLVANNDGYAENGRFCMFIDHEYDGEESKTIVNLEDCTFNASGYGCVKVAGDKGATITVNVKGCTFYNTCPSNSWDKNTPKTPKWDIKKTGKNITVNNLEGNTWSSGRNAGIGEG